MKRSTLLLTMLFVVARASAAEWMQFRGAGASGVSDEEALPVKWSAKENIVWRTALPGPGTSSPIEVRRRVFLTCYSGYGITPGKDGMEKLLRHVVCTDRRSGAIVWTMDFKPELPESTYSGGNNTQHGFASSTLASDGRRLYAFFGKSGVFCLDLDGKVIWRQTVGSGTHGWGTAASPVLYQNLVLVNASIESSALVALDRTTGKEVWRAKDIKMSWSTPVLVTPPDGGTEIVINDSKAVIGLDPRDGKELWRVGGFTTYVCPSVVTDKGIVYVVRGEAMAIKPGGRGDVTATHVLWRNKARSKVASPAFHNGRLYWSDDSHVCLDAATGKELYRNRPPGATFYASPVVADGKVYCVSRTGGIFVLDAGAEFKQLAHNRFEDDDSRTNASPIVSGGCLLLRTDRHLYCIGKKE